MKSDIDEEEVKVVQSPIKETLEDTRLIADFH